MGSVPITGQFGGGWGDDVEMWRHWATVLIGFEDPKVNAAQEKTASGLFALGRMAGGYTSRMSDVEHDLELRSPQATRVSECPDPVQLVSVIPYLDFHQQLQCSLRPPASLG